MSETARWIRTANGMNGAQRPSQPMSTPGKRRAIDAHGEVTATAAPSRTSVSVWAANAPVGGERVGTEPGLVGEGDREAWP